MAAPVGNTKGADLDGKPTPSGKKKNEVNNWAGRGRPAPLRRRGARPGCGSSVNLKTTTVMSSASWSTSQAERN